MYCQATALESMVTAFLQCFKSLELRVKKRTKTIPGALALFDAKLHLTSAPAFPALLALRAPPQLASAELSVGRRFREQLR